MISRNQNMQRLSIMVPAATVEAIDKITELNVARGWNRSDTVREALAVFVGNNRSVVPAGAPPRDRPTAIERVPRCEQCGKRAAGATLRGRRICSGCAALAYLEVHRPPGDSTVDLPACERCGKPSCGIDFMGAAICSACVDAFVAELVRDPGDRRGSVSPAECECGAELIFSEGVPICRSCDELTDKAAESHHREDLEEGGQGGLIHDQ